MNIHKQALMMSQWAAEYVRESWNSELQWLIDIMNSRRDQRLYGYLRIIPSTANQVLNAESSVTQVQQLVLMSGADYIRSLTFHFISSPTWTELEHKYHKQISKV
jgi:hypothetical protein